MRHAMLRRRLVAGASVVVAASIVRAALGEAAAAEQWHTRGVIRKIASDRTSVSIAHEAIDGYMGAMTMSFEPRRVAQLDGLKVDDRVSLSFTDTDDGRRLIDTIAKL